MNKAQLVEQIAKVTKLPKSTCKTALEGFIIVISQSLKKEKNVVLTGFGTFSVVKRKTRMGVNPATGQRMKIMGKKVPKFKSGKALKDLIAQ